MDKQQRHFKIIIVGGEPDVHGVARHAKQEWGLCTPVSITCAQVLSRTLCVEVQKKGLCKSDRQENWRTWKPRMATPSRKCKFAALSRSSLAVHCVGVSAFRFPTVVILGLIATTMHYTVHHHARTRNVSVLQEWDRHGQSVGRCTCSHRLR